MEPLANEPAGAVATCDRPLNLDDIAAEAVRRLHGELRNLIFLTTVADPFSGSDRNIDIYADDQDFEYWLSPDNGRLIQASPRAGLHQATHPAGPVEPSPVAYLRERAMTIIEREVPGFRERISCFHPFEENRRRSLYLFRWEDGSVDDGEIPPFVQVGLYADGSVACFTNALS
jgi:hypothetical protein